MGVALIVLAGSINQIIDEIRTGLNFVGFEVIEFKCYSVAEEMTCSCLEHVLLLEKQIEDWKAMTNEISRCRSLGASCLHRKKEQ